MPALANYPIPHLLGRFDYENNRQLRPDGDTVHLFDPVVLLNGEAFAPKKEQLEVWVAGSTKPRLIPVKGKPGKSYVPVRFEGLDAPEEHYRSQPFTTTAGGGKQEYKFDPAVAVEERSQPRWSPATEYVMQTLTRAGWALVLMDREVIDGRGRALGYVYASDALGTRKEFVSLELIKQGLAFPFLFESAKEFISQFLSAATVAKRQKLGVWRRYRHRPLPFNQTFPAPAKHTDAEPEAQLNAPLNLPGVFRRVVDAHQLKGLTLKTALQKYDAMDYDTGAVLPGDQYHRIPIERLIWAPRRFH